MDVNIECGICGFSVSADETDGPGAEHLTQLFTAVHEKHTPREVNSFIWANGSYPVGHQHKPKDDDE